MSEERIFKVGDVVMLKSGGPKMTVLAKYDLLKANASKREGTS